MLAVICMLAFVSAGGVVGSAFFKKRYEETTIISVSAIILLIFLFGIFKHLKEGLVVACALGSLCYLVSIFYVVKIGAFKAFIKNIITPGFLFLVGTTILLSFLLSGKHFEAWDEFSHWGDVVKAMVTIDDFSTSPLSHSQFQSYPPAMAILQYCTEKFNSRITGIQFVEWINYPTYFIFVASFILPCFRSFDKFNLKSLFLGIILFCVPQVFYPNFYSCLYIDPALSVLLFIGLFLLFAFNNDDSLFLPQIACVCSILPITKDAGMLFSVFIGVTALVLICLNTIKDRKTSVKSHKSAKILNLFIHVFSISSAIAIPKVLWNYSIDSNHAFRSFAGKVDLGILVNVLLKRDTSYRREVLGNYVKEFFSNGIGNNGVRLSYFALALALGLGLFYFSKRLVSYHSADKSNRRIALVTTVVLFVVYIFGACVMYMFKFTEYEAIHLASFNRYMNIMFCGLGYLLNVLLIVSVTKSDYKKPIVALCIILLLSPLDYYSRLFKRKLVIESNQYRRQYISIIASVDNISVDEGKVYILSQEDNGEDYEKIKYIIRPRITYSKWIWSIGETPYYDGDIFTHIVDRDAWINELFDEYSYLIVYESNDWFTSSYSEYFEGEISDRQLYKVDADSRKLTPVFENGTDYINSLYGKDYTIFISIKADGPLMIDSGMQKSLKDLGFDSEFDENTECNYVSVINNGVVLASASGEQRVECQDRFDFGHTYNAWLDGAEGQIIVDGLDYSTNRRGINIVVYDNKTNCVIDTVNIDTYTDDQIVRRYI